MPRAVTEEASMGDFQQWCLGFTEELVGLLSLSGKESGDDFKAGQRVQVPEHSLCPACGRLRVALASIQMSCGQLLSVRC